MKKWNIDCDHRGWIDLQKATRTLPGFIGGSRDEGRVTEHAQKDDPFKKMEAANHLIDLERLGCVRAGTMWGTMMTYM